MKIFVMPEYLSRASGYEILAKSSAFCIPSKAESQDTGHA